MKKKAIILFLFILFFSPTTLYLQAETERETAYSDTITIPWGYLYQINRRIPSKDTTTTISITATAVVDFFIADEGDTDEYIEGGSISVYVDERNFTSGEFVIILQQKQLYEFVVENYYEHLEEVAAAVLIVFEYEGGSFIWILWVVLGIFGVGGFIFLIQNQRQKRSQQAYSGTPGYQVYQSTDTYRQHPVQPDTTPSTKFCSSCGLSNDYNARFCTNCGYKLE
ncbi:MAG: zinc ribbon domain-containing protein [Candidatus Heimdallarchaeota archaeon]|nr:zinc ribbon domain-containing protein [Candidatus Heimdallarchaeota archaeon]MCK4955277.1 zinc ribbon domain-containing protein [Candidatus Heimdallarchaeota archaeon]